MRTLHLFSHWQTGNSVIQLAVAAICMEEFGFEHIMPLDSDNPPTGFFACITDKIWEIKWEMLGMHGDPRMQDFYKHETVVQGYFQNSEPLVMYRDRIIAAFKDDTRLHFPITHSKATIKDLLYTPSPIELGSTDVVMHIRLGDYREAKWVIDPAPQLAILRKIRRAELTTRIIIVCQAPKTDAERNYLKLFEEFHPIIQSGTEVEDFAVLRSANRILVTNSSFSWAAAWLGAAAERWIPEPTFNELGPISPIDTIYRAAHGYDMSGFDIPTELLPVTGEFLQSLCEYTIMDAKKEAEIGHTVTAKKLFIEDEWSVKPQSLFIYPEQGLLEAVVARGLRPRLIIIHNGDNQPDYSVLIPFLEANPQMYAWLQNNTVSHPRIRSLPIGEQNRMWRGGSISWEPSVKVNRDGERSCDFLYTWCGISHADRLTWMTEAKALRGIMPTLELYAARIPREDYLDAMISAKAVICPRGNGLDTHRAWETLCKGAWAIVPDNQHTRCLLEEYPSLPLIPLSSPAALPAVPVPVVPSPFHPIILRQFWKTLFASHVD